MPNQIDSINADKICTVQPESECGDCRLKGQLNAV